MAKIRSVVANYWVAFVSGIILAGVNFYLSSTTCQSNPVTHSVIVWILGSFLIAANLPARLIGSTFGIETGSVAILSALMGGFIVGKLIHRNIKNEPNR